MAPVIWGLDLKEIQWNKFKNSNMWNNEYHLRRTRFIIYQCAMIFCVTSESLGTAALSDYIDSQNLVAQLDPRVYVFNNDYIGAASYNIFSGIFVATIFGAAFFFDLFWPERRESRAVLLSWQICAVLAAVFSLASALTLTEITSVHCGYFRGPEGVNDGYGQELLDQYTKDGGTPLCYRKNPRAVAAVVFAWLGWLGVLGSCVVMFRSISHTNKGLGPKSTHARLRDAEKASTQSLPKTDAAGTRKDDVNIPPPYQE
ncbi:hypothetical protein CERZMDRAFT_46797 [Cercospora zeae-maydis SCOH1-5]|uniref:MARVEL domain-containing protein n=1 Tax=Cercospora zeae-maydis SCOH1-5 TaxID=717836 RepID=A0A6A6F8I7_9PEZI|nr:hypothetical protein CERZMDRAFT_46797 [Cercospora zeae-maydis SCOH1-5]